MFTDEEKTHTGKLMFSENNINASVHLALRKFTIREEGTFIAALFRCSLPRRRHELIAGDFRAPDVD